MRSIFRKAALGAAVTAAGGAATRLLRRRGRTAATSDGAAAPGTTAPPADQGHGLAPERAPAPVETPGPSVPAPAAPESDTERTERADALKPEPDPAADRTDGPVDELVAEEESAAAAEAAAIGGPHAADEPADPAMAPVYEAGGGEAEGFEAAEQDLIANASHDEGHGNPLRDAIAPEAESDRSGAAYGDPDEIHPTETVDDADGDQRDPGATPR